MLDLLFLALRVLFRRVEIEAWSPFVVVAQDDLFARLILFGDVVRGVRL